MHSLLEWCDWVAARLRIFKTYKICLTDMNLCPTTRRAVTQHYVHVFYITTFVLADVHTCIRFLHAYAYMHAEHDRRHCYMRTEAIYPSHFRVMSGLVTVIFTVGHVTSVHTFSKFVDISLIHTAQGTSCVCVPAALCTLYRQSADNWSWWPSPVDNTLFLIH